MPKKPVGIKFVREGETLSRNNFAMLMNRFISECFAPEREREENETELHYIQNVKEPHKANALRAEVFMDKLIEMLTPEQKRELVQDAPADAQKFVQKVIEKKMVDMARSTSGYYEKRKRATAMGPGPEKDRLEAELDAFDKLVNRVKKGNYTLEESKNIYKPYLTKEQLNDPVLDPVNHVSTRFIIDAHEYVSDKVVEMLRPSQVQELGDTVDKYVIPWDREPKEMGETVYDQESENAKADIDAMPNLTPKQKEEMKADIDAANNFLRQPSKTEDPESIYFGLATAYENAVKHDGESANKAMMKKEGLEFDVIEEKVNEESFSSDFFVKEGKEKEFQKWQENEFKFSPKTKEAIKHVFSMMKNFGYGGKGFIGEQGIKQYGLSMLAGSIFAYKDAIKSGDATKIAETSQKMIEEKEHVNEILDYVREHFPIDRHSDNFAKAGNVDVARNGTFPPEYRMDEAVSTLNSLFIIMNFAEGNGISPEEFLEKPSHYIRDFYFDKFNIGLNNALKGKTGGEALFEASKKADYLFGESPTVGAIRVVEGMSFLDMDPEIRLHNHALGDFYEHAVVRNGNEDIRRRTIAYEKGHLDRFLFVDEPRDNASLLGVPIFNAGKMKYEQPEAFDELHYLQNNGKSLAEMKETFDKNVKEYLLLSVTKLTKDSFGKPISYPAYENSRLVEIAQQAASKILIAKYAERHKNAAFDALKGILTNGQEYVNNLIQAEKNKVIDAEKQLEEATKTGDAKKINELKAYIEANKAYKDIQVKVKEPKQKYAQTLESFEKKIAEFRKQERSAGVDLKPHEDFNKAMVNARKELDDLNVRIVERENELRAKGASFAKDDEMQILEAAKANKLTEIESAKKDYLESLDRDVKDGRIPAYFKEMRENQINSPTYKYDILPSLFQKSAEIMSKDQYLAQVADSARAEGVVINWADYDDADKDALYDVYVQEQNALQDPEIADFVLKQDSQALGFVKTEPEAPKAEEKVAEKAEEKVEEKVTDFTGRWFEPGTQLSKEAFIEKLELVDRQRTEPEVKGNNWLERRQSIEAATSEGDRLKFFYEESMQKLSPEGKQAVFETLENGSREIAEREAKDRYAELISNKSAQAKELTKTFKNMSLDDVKKASEPFLSAEEKKDPRLTPHNNIETYFTSALGNPRVWKAIVDNLPEEDFKDLAYRTEAHKALLERSIDEFKVPQYGKEFGEVKGILQGMKYYKGEELTEAKRAEIEGKLDKAQDLLSALDKSYDSVLGNVRMGREEYKYGMNDVRSHTAEEILKSEGIEVHIEGSNETTIVFDGIKGQKTGYMSSEGDVEMDQVQEGYEAQYQKLQERKIQMRQETKDAVKNIFAKFDEYGFDQGEFNPEEDGKIYGLHRYAKARGEFEATCSSSDPVEKIKSVEAAEKMITEYNHVQEIIGIAKDAFNLDKGGFYSGNMDVERNGAFPPEWRKDISGISMLNGLYVMYRTLKQQNVNLDEFLDDPRAYMNKETRKVVDETDVNNTIKGKTGAAAITDIITPYQNRGTKEFYRIGRAVETMSKLETDPEMARNNMASEYAYSVSGQFQLQVIGLREELPRLGNGFLDNYLIVKEPQQDASLLGFPTYDFNTMKARPRVDFDEIDYLWNLQETPDEYLNRILKEGGKTLAWMQKNQAALGITNDTVIQMIQKASLKYLVAHPELDKRSDAYKTMNDIVEKGPAVIGEHLQAMKEGEFADELEGLDLDRLDFESMESIYPSMTLSQYAKSREMRNFGEDVRTADKNANREFSNLQAELERANQELERATSAFAIDRASQKKLELEGKLEQAIADRKEQLMKDFRDGRITEQYLNKRNEQLDGGKFRDNLPKMFEADELMSKNDYLRKEYPDDFASLSKDEKDEIYKHYVDNAKLAKDQFVAKKYLEFLGLRQKFEQKTMAERIEEKNAQLAMQEKAQEAQKAEPQVKQGEPQVNKDQPEVNGAEVNKDQPEVKQAEVKQEEPKVEKEEPKVENIEVNLEEEEEIEFKPEEKAQEKAQEKEQELDLDDGVEQISIDLDDEDVEMINDILKVGGKEKNISKDPLSK